VKIQKHQKAPSEALGPLGDDRVSRKRQGRKNIKNCKGGSELDESGRADKKHLGGGTQGLYAMGESRGKGKGPCWAVKNVKVLEGPRAL